MAPQRDSPYCWSHDPANAKEADEARRLGGMRRKREGTLAGAYDFEGLTTVPDIRRLLDVAAYDVLGLDNGIPRIRAIVAIVMAASKLLETGELEDRIKALEAAKHRHDEQHSVFDEPDDPGDPFPEAAA